MLCKEVVDVYFDTQICAVFNAQACWRRQYFINHSDLKV